MRRFYLIGFALLMGFDTLTQISFKLAGMHALPVQANLAWLLRLFGEPWVYGAVLGYLGAFFTWMSLLKHAPIGVMALSVWLFHEPLTATKLLGAAAILAGIVCLGLAERDAAPHESPGSI
ncbi:MAG: hypothetical protein ABT19_16060 [Rhodanobacter sp. SCN 68-63]|nr:MAG: hypothetical protein ABT19_16060 [Rhodanobacter sp. SCN 68-63]